MLESLFLVLFAGGAVSRSCSPLQEQIVKSVNKKKEGVLSQEQKNTKLWFALKNGNIESVQYWLMHGAQANAQDERGNLPLVQVIYSGRKDLFYALLQHNTHIDAQDKQGRTALICASLMGCAHEVAALLQAGAWHDLLTNTGESAYSLAADNQAPAHVSCKAPRHFEQSKQICEQKRLVIRQMLYAREAPVKALVKDNTPLPMVLVDLVMQYRMADPSPAQAAARPIVKQ